MSEHSLNKSLPHWLAVAFIARCARRYAEVFIMDSSEPLAVRVAIEEAVQLAEKRTEIGGSLDFHEAIVLDGKFFDNYDVTSLHAALLAYSGASENTYVDLMGDPSVEPTARLSLTAHRLACLAIESAFPDDTGASDIPDLNCVVEWALSDDSQFRARTEEDLALIERLAEQEGWGDEKGISQEALSPL